MGFLDDLSAGGLRGQFYNYWLLEVILMGSMTMSGKFVASRVSKRASSKTRPRTYGNSIGFLDDFLAGGLRGQLDNYWLLEVILMGSITMSRSSL